MRRQDGICVVNAQEMKKIKFEGIIVPEVNIPLELVKVKEGYYKEGKYVQKKLFLTEIPEGTGIKQFKEKVYSEISSKKICDFQVPDILITEKVLKFIEGW